MTEGILLLMASSDFPSLSMQTQQQKVYQAFYRLAYQVIIQITKDHAATEDIIQESFLKAIDHKPAIRSEAQLINWLKVVIRNSTYNYLRKHKKRLNEVDVESVFIDNTIDYATEVDFIEREINVKELEAAIGKYLQELKPDFRCLIEMRWKYDMSYKEIAEVLGTDEKTVKYKLHRARSAIKCKFLQEWSESL